MFISKSNALYGRTPNILEGVSSDTPSAISNPDFSVNYTASGGRIVLSFGAVSSLDYIAVCASNLGTSGKITVRNGDSSAGYNSVRGQYLNERDHVCMFNFERENFSNLKIVVDSENSNSPPTIFYIAAGQSIKVPNGGETAGYQRNWLGRGYQSRVQGNDLAAPIAYLQRRVALNGSLNLPNMTKGFTRTEIQEFYDYALSQPFFVCEQEDLVTFSNYESYRSAGGLPEASYICFNPSFTAPTAHSATRALNDFKLSFECYNGL